MIIPEDCCSYTINKLMRLPVFISILSIVVWFSSCASKKHTNISYLQDSSKVSEAEEPKLNVFVPKRIKRVKSFPS